MPFLAQALNPEDVGLHFRRRLPGLVGAKGGLNLLSIRVTRHKAGRRCLIEYDVVVERPGAFPEAMTLVGKARARGLDKLTYGTIHYLWNHGFQTDSADGISVPQPVGVVPEFQMWLHRKAPGVSATHLLDEAARVPGVSQGGIGLAPRIAEAVHKLHGAGARPARRHTVADELRILHERLGMLAVERPGWSRRLERLLRACDRLGAGIPRTARTGVHRDFYAEHVLVDGERLYLIDFDLYSEGDPALDVGNFLGHMTEQSLRELGDPDALADREGALEARFLELAATTSRPSVRAYRALTLARHVHLSTLFPQRRAFTEDLLELCERELGLGDDLPIGDYRLLSAE
jgi:hypothetical protein